MPSRWDSGIVVWNASDKMLVLKEGKSGVYVVDPNQKGRPVVYEFGPLRYVEACESSCNTRRRSRMPAAAAGAAIGGFAGALWLGLRSAPSVRQWYVRIDELNGKVHYYYARNRYDAKKMERRIQRHIDGKVNAAPEPPVGYTPADR